MIEDRDSWETPKELFEKLDKQYRFSVDCCAIKENRKCLNFYYDFNSATLNSVNNDMCWMNPPFSKAYEMFEHFFNVVKQGVAIYRCDNMETKVWQNQILKNASWVFIFNKRVSYEGQVGKGARFPSALIGFNVISPNLKNGYLLRIDK